MLVVNHLLDYSYSYIWGLQQLRLYGIRLYPQTGIGQIILARGPKPCGGAKGYCNIRGAADDDDDDDDDGEVHDEDKGDDDCY